jgi:hypothetical protein
VFVIGGVVCISYVLWSCWVCVYQARQVVSRLSEVILSECAMSGVLNLCVWQRKRHRILVLFRVHWKACMRVCWVECVVPQYMCPCARCDVVNLTVAKL